MPPANAKNEIYLRPSQLDKLYRRHFQGALVRAGASLFMWLYAFAAYKLGVIESKYIAGVTISVLYLILINPPHLWILRYIRKRRTYEFTSIVVNFFEIVGYTAIIYTMGGINALYLSPLYAAVIAYVGAVSPPRMPFIIASLAAGSLFCMAALQFYEIIPPMETFWKVQLPRSNQLVVGLATICLLYVNAFIISYTGGLLRKNKMTLYDQNLMLENSRDEIERTAELLERQNRELETAVQQAQESEALKSEFLANMSHELRTPLNHIIGFTDLIMNPKLGELNPVQAEYLSDVQHSGRHLLTLINDILDFSKIEAGKLEINCAPLSPQAFADSCLAMVNESAKNKGVYLSLSCDNVPSQIFADEVRLRQIVYNLLSNAVKFTPSGGQVTVSVNRLTTTDPSVRSLPSKEANGYLQFSVSDTGAGVKEKDLGKVFRSFEQVKNHVAQANEGTGLGLAIAKNLVELQGGKIWVDSQGAGQGCTFTFILPILQLPQRSTDTGQLRCSEEEG